MTSRVSSVTFPRASYNLRQAMKWLKEHDLKPSKRVDKSATKLRYRILDPAQFDHFATKEVSGGIQLIIGFPEPEQQAQDPFPTSSQQPAPGPPKGGKPTKRSAARGGAVGNTWLMHVKAYRAAHVGISYKESLRGASTTWKRINENS